MAAKGSRFYTPSFFDVNANGVPYIGGKLYFYVTGTTTPLDTYSDVNLTVPNTNPIISVDAAGHFGNVFLVQTQGYRVKLTDSNDVEVWTYDDVGPGASSSGQVVPGIVGEVKDFAGLASAIPSGWALCYGQPVSRASYAALFAVLSTAWGPGDGSTTFNLPDLRGRITAGIDNMGGVAANRVTAGVCLIAGTTLGAAGGDQRAQTDTLSAVSVVTDPTHNHSTSAVEGPHATPGVGIGGGAVGYSFNPASNVAAATGITVATTVTSGLLGSSQNVQPTAMLNKIIYLGA
jgi:microcystin-dependent protein